MNYLISANSYRLIKEEIKKIVKNKNYLVFNMNINTISDLLEEASYYSLDSSDKVIVASNADFFGTKKLEDKDQAALEKYLNNPIKSTTIIFTTLNGIDQRKKICKEFKLNNALVSIDKLDRKGIMALLNKYLDNHSFKADYNSLNYIIENSNDNLDIMYNELDKIMLYYSNYTNIKFSDVKKIVGEKLDNNNFHFVSAVVDKKLDEAIKLFNDLKVYKIEPLSLLILLAREYRLMYFVKNLYKDVGVSGLTKRYNLMEWQVNKLYNNALNYTQQELLDNLYLLAKTDISIKKGLWDKEIAIYNFLLNVCS